MATFISIATVRAPAAVQADHRATIGAWTPSAALPQGRIDFGFVSTGTSVYIVGGCIDDCIDRARTSVLRAPVTADGEIGAWETVSSLVQPRQGLSVVYTHGRLYAIGGSDGGYVTTVQVATVQPDGSLGPWSLEAEAMSVGRLRFSAVVLGEYLYAIGGAGLGPTTVTERAPILSDGSLGPWENAPALNAHRQEFATFVAQGHLYALGGWMNTTIERAPIYADGSIGAWSVIGDLPNERHSFMLAVDGPDVYLMGGGKRLGEWSVNWNSVDVASLQPDGTLGAWRAMPYLTHERGYGAALVAGPYLYAIGGGSVTGAHASTTERATLIRDVTPPQVTQVSLNKGALTTTSTAISVDVQAIDSGSGVGALRLSNDGNIWSAWRTIAATTSWDLTAGDGAKAVYVQVQDLNLNASSVVSASIELDSAVGVDAGFTINQGALFTNATAVRLRISAPPRTSQMQISNDGGFAGASWEPYNSTRTWTITRYGVAVLPRVVYLRYRDVNGVVSPVVQDDIILDVTAPRCSLTLQPGAPAAPDRPVVPLERVAALERVLFLPAMALRFCPSSSGTPQYTLLASATDDVSGVASMRLSNTPDFPCGEWEPFRASLAWYAAPGTTQVYMQVMDWAGNISSVETAPVSP